MSRQIDLTKPLSDEDRAYLEQRDRWRDIAIADGEDEWHSSLPDDALGNAFGSSPSAVSAAVGDAPTDAQGNYLPPESSGSASEASEDDEESEEPEEEAGDDYDDEEKWSYDALKAEVKGRKEELGDEYDGPALNSSRADLVEWLRSDDEAQSDV